MHCDLSVPLRWKSSRSSIEGLKRSGPGLSLFLASEIEIHLPVKSNILYL